jgi:hypothetical protein
MLAWGPFEVIVSETIMRLTSDPNEIEFRFPKSIEASLRWNWGKSLSWVVTEIP